MNLGWKHLAGQLLNGADLSKASLEEIDILLDEYPYFAGLHFLKAVKMKAIQPDGLSGNYSKASLYFPNPHWYSLMLEHSVPSVLHEADISVPQIEVEDEDKEDNSEEFNGLQQVDTDIDVTEINVVEIAEEPVSEIHEPEPQPKHDWEQNLAENPVFQQHQVSDEERTEQEIWHQQAAEPVMETPVEEIISPPLENIEAEEILETESPETRLSEEPSVSTEVEEIIAEENFHIQPEQEIEFSENEAPLVEEAVIDTVEEPEQETVPQPLEEAPKTAEPVVADLGIPFEPLYTIDYFASQGIKIAAEATPKDQLSLKLRSFTEWLRAMKKLHPEKIDKDFNQDQEEQVRVIAESSNATEIVYTEAMAEVFIKQGKRGKAREVFEKLSLLDPGKSAYFAVRIKELKEN
ncbi:MAG: hypothetical protein WBP58_02155 [Chitinophagaceae bacterium]